MKVATNDFKTGALIALAYAILAAAIMGALASNSDVPALLDCSHHAGENGMD